MNAAISSAVAQNRVSTFGQVPYGFRPLPMGGVAGGNTTDPHTARTIRPQPGYGHGRGMAGTSMGPGRIVAGGVVRDSGTARTYPAPFVVHPTRISGLGASGMMAKTDLQVKGNVTDWKYQGPLIPGIGGILGAAIGAKISGKVWTGGAIGAVLGWLATAGLLTATQANHITVNEGTYT